MLRKRAPADNIELLAALDELLADVKTHPSHPRLN
jgi:hypothetical protein